LYAEVSASAESSRVFYVMIALSSVVAAIGLWRDNDATADVDGFVRRLRQSRR
jgi:hypothetical protein